MMHVNQLEAAFAEVNQLYEAGQISKEEYLNLLQGFQLEETISYNAEELQKKEQLNAYINAVITAVSMAA